MTKEAKPKTDVPRRAIVLAAGLGTRMRPVSSRIPKPLVKVAGKALIDHALDRLAAVGVAEAVVNVHYLAEQIERHLAPRQRPRVIISDERQELLGTGGGVVKALPQLGHAPFFSMNSDTLWTDGAKPNLLRLAENFDPQKMDALLLLAPTTGSIGYEERGDFAMSADGRLRRRGEGQAVPFAYASAALLSPALFNDAPKGPFALTLLFDRAAEAGRLHGLRIDGIWMHVGTPEAVAEAETAMSGNPA
ncbi:MAG TPA: nucleotidyltransferase family protein [Xanthobacteraceae bacterium]|nr:nucleotidyltransferase family protein [Xanthobacteraceae bacterium]